MASVNKIKPIYTHEGAKARHLTSKQQLERSVMSCMLWENTFYEDGVSIVSRIKDLTKECDAQDVADIALRAKHDMRLRHVPLLLVRELFRDRDSRKLAADTLAKIISRPDDITEFLALYWNENKDEPLAKQAKLVLGRAFHKFDEYSLQKYNGGSKAIKLVDALRIVHPEKSELLGKLRRNELATPDTWEVEISQTTDKKASWTRLIQEEKLGGFAMLRNLRNMREASVDAALIKEGIAKINAGKLMPINFIAAGIHNTQFEPNIEAKFFESFQKDKTAGKTIVLVDTSGSMNDRLSAKSEMRRMDVASSLAMIARETFEDMRLFCFSNLLGEMPARRGFAIKDLINGFEHGGTDLGGAIKYIIENVEYDRLIVITDEQSNSRVPDFKGYLINVASNKNGVGYGQCVHIDGWSDRVINYILQCEK